MRTVTLSLASQADFDRRASAAFAGRRQGAHITFASADLLWQTMTRKRWDILAAMTGKGPMSMRAAADLVGRDVKAVHSDIKALVVAGVLDQGGKGVEFPYDAVRVDFKFEAAA